MPQTKTHQFQLGGCLREWVIKLWLTAGKEYIIRKGIPINHGDSGFVGRVASKSQEALTTFRSGQSLGEFQYNAFINFGHLLDLAIHNNPEALSALGRVVDFHQISELQVQLVDYRSILADIMSGGQVESERLESLGDFFTGLEDYHMSQVSATPHPEAHQSWFKEWD